MFYKGGTMSITPTPSSSPLNVPKTVKDDIPFFQREKVKTVVKQALKFLVRIFVFTIAVGAGALLGALIPIPTWGIAFGAAVGFAAGFLVHNKVMSMIDNMDYFKK